MRIFLIFLFSLLILPASFAKHQYEEYGFGYLKKYEIKGSNNYYQFNSNLIQDKDVIKKVKNKKTKRNYPITILDYKN